MNKKYDKRKHTRFRQKTERVLDKTLKNMAEGITSDKRALVLSAGHVFQALRKGEFLSQLLREWKEYRDKGRIKEDYETSEQHLSCLQEMLDFLDKDLPDQKWFDTLKKIFMVAATDPNIESSNLLPHQYMRVCRTLSTGEIIVLSTTYKIAKKGCSDEHVSAASWLETIGKESELVHSALIEFHEEELMKKRLLTPRVYSDRSGVITHPHFRLSNFGYDICRFIDKYQKNTQPEAPST